MTQRHPTSTPSAAGAPPLLTLVSSGPSTDGQAGADGARKPKPRKPGRPSTTERGAVYLGELRNGGPPPGWLAARAREWGISQAVVSRELAAARGVLDESRSPDAVQATAHELTVQAQELAEEIEALARTPLERGADDQADLLEARAKVLTEQTRALGLAASLKLRTASTLLAVHKTELPGAGFRGHRPDPNKLLRDTNPFRHPGLSALKGTP